MLRFLPDTWWLALLRPLLMADPNSGLYFELPAPDLRFALLVLAALAWALAGRRRRPLPPAALRLGASLVVMFAVWTVVTGNGRYFMAGLLCVGPLLVALLAALPGTAALRVTLLGLVLVLQAVVVQQNFSPGQWALARWSERGPGLAVAPDAAWPPQPAVFLTLTNISFSLLVPQADPRSRWASIAGQIEMDRRLPEYPRFQQLLASPLPRYVVLPTMPLRPAPGDPPPPALVTMADRSLAPHGLRVQPGVPCVLAPSRLVSAAPRASADDRGPLPLGFWFCPLGTRDAVEPAPAEPPLMVAVARALETRCPRWFPPGGVTVQLEGGVAVRHYPMSDMRLYVEPQGDVFVRYLRALNPTRVAPAAEVAAGRFSLDCSTMPGRYVPPWARD